MQNITLQPISVLSDGGSHEGRLVLADGDLVAVFVRLSAEETMGGAPHAGDWFLEAGFGPCGNLMTASQPAFATLEDAVVWVHERLDSGILPS